MTREEALVKVKGYLTDYLLLEDADEIDEIIEALKQQPCEDCVSRQAVLDTIGNIPDYDDGMVWEALSHAQRDVALLPSATPKVEWIPVSEGLPETDDDVLVTNGRGMYIGWIDTRDKLWRVDSESEYFMYDIVAWKPLPQPYAESEDKG